MLSGVDAAGNRARRLALEESLPARLRTWFPGWCIWEDRTGWHARKGESFRQLNFPAVPLFAGSPAGLWVALVLAADREDISPSIAANGEVASAAAPDIAGDSRATAPAWGHLG